MKKVLALTITTLALSQTAFSRGGGNGGNNDLIARGTQAWFAAESLEHTARGLVESGRLSDAGVTSASVDLTSTSTATVGLTNGAGTLASACQMFEESSRHGTILKKEVACGGMVESRLRLTRGSDAWAVVEGFEHSLRMAILADQSVLESVTGATSELQSNVAVLVAIELNNGQTLNYTCSRLYYNTPSASELNCARTN